MKITSGFILVIIIILALPSEAQRRKSRKKEAPEIEIPSEEKALKAEATYIEAEKQLLLENYVKANDLFLLALELSPDNAAIHFKLAEVLLKRGSIEKALYHAEKSLELNTKNKYFYLMAIEANRGLNDFDRVAELYEEMLANVEGTDQYIFDLAQIYHFQNKLDKALETYELGEERYGLDEVVIREKQKIYLRQNDMESLMSDWDRLIDSNRGYAPYVVELANLLMLNGMEDEAESRLLEFKENEAPDLSIDLGLSELQRRRGNLDKALSYLEAPLLSDELEITPKLQVLNGYLTLLDNTEVRAELLRLTAAMADKFTTTFEAQAFAGDVHHQADSKDSAIVYYLNAIEIEPNNFNVWQNVLNLELQGNQYDSVVLHAERALEYFPNQAILYYFGGTGHYLLQNNKEAAFTLEQGKKYTSEPELLTIFLGQLGDVYNSLEEHDKSDRAYEEALKNQPDNDHVLNNYSYFLSLRKKDMDKALEMSTKLVEQHPDNPTYLDTHGWVLYVIGNYKEAKGFLEKAAQLNDTDGTIIEHYGDVLYQLGEVEAALEQWQKASELEGTTDLLDQKIADQKLYE